MTFLEKLCAFYQISIDEYHKLTEAPSLEKLPSPEHFNRMKEATERIELAILNHEKIFIYGDYDCDGIMATSILVKAFQKRGVTVGYYIPSRYLDGYGLTEEKVQLAYEKGYTLLITVDNGIAQFDAVKKARELGIDVIVTDHHSLQEKTVDANYILHPIYSHYGDTICCGAYVAFMLSWALLKEADPYLLSLAAIATISDMMELKEYNREIVRLAMQILKEHPYSTIASLAGEEPLDEQTMGLIIAPKINAVGRIATSTQVNRLVRYFTTTSVEEEKSIYQMIEEANKIRKEWTKKAVESLSIEESDASIVVISDQKEGLIGLIANRILQQYEKPVIVFAHSMEDGVLKGSARAKLGFSIVDVFKENQDLLLVAGGHALAGGCSLKEENLPLFQTRFNTYAQAHPFIEEKKETVELSLDEITVQNYEILRSLAPFGMGFPMPEFRINDMVTSAFSYISNGEHIMTPLSMKTKIVGFHMPREEVSLYPKVNLIGSFKMNYYKGKETLQFMIKEMEAEQITLHFKEN